MYWWSRLQISSAFFAVANVVSGRMVLPHLVPDMGVHINIANRSNYRLLWDFAK